MESEFTRELLVILKEIIQQEPYISELGDDEKRLILGRMAWTTGVVMCQNDQEWRARPYLEEALYDYDILKYPKQAAYPIVVHYLLGSPHSKSLVAATLKQIKLPSVTANKFSEYVWKEYFERRFYLDHQAKRWAEVRRDGWWVVKNNPDRLIDRGFMSIWLDSILGKQITNLFRRTTHTIS